jgi:hypothetical protein
VFAYRGDADRYTTPAQGTTPEAQRSSACRRPSDLGYGVTFVHPGAHHRRRDSPGVEQALIILRVTREPHAETPPVGLESTTR